MSETRDRRLRAGEPGTTGADRARAIGRGLGTGAKVTGRGLRGMGRVTGRFSSYTMRQAKRASRAQGAEQSGLSRLIELHAANAAGDAAVAISLATTIFFAGATSEARGQVALFLGLTMLPFAIVAPLIGPFLDRFSHGRRWAIGSTFAIRAFLCWVLANAVADESNLLYPAALGILVSSKAYGVTRAAAVPRLRPDDLTLVKANSRVSLAGVVGASASAPIAGALAAIAFFGTEWTLRWAFVLFVVGTILAIRLPEKVDSSAGEQEMVLRGDEQPGKRRHPDPGLGRVRAARQLRSAVDVGLPDHVHGVPAARQPDRGLASRAADRRSSSAAAGLGNTLGIFAASILKRINPAVTVVAALLADAAMALLCAVFYGIVPLVLLGLTAGLAQALAKVSLDSTIQSDVPTQVQSSAFARSDTTLQLSWVVGGFVGIALPLNPHLGLGVACAALGAWAVFVLGSRPRNSGRPATAPAPVSR